MGSAQMPQSILSLVAGHLRMSTIMLGKRLPVWLRCVAVVLSKIDESRASTAFLRRLVRSPRRPRGPADWGNATANGSDF